MVIPNKYEIGGKPDIEMAQVLQARPYEEILTKVGEDWGKNSDIFHLLLELYMAPKFNYKAFIQLLQNYDVYDEYKHLLNLNESIRASEAHNIYSSIQTLIDNKRNVALISNPNFEVANMIGESGLKSLKITKNPHNVWIIYREGAEAQAQELLAITDKYDGYAAANATEEDSRKIGQLLGYVESDIDDYIKRSEHHRR